MMRHTLKAIVSLFSKSSDPSFFGGMTETHQSVHKSVLHSGLFITMYSLYSVQHQQHHYPTQGPTPQNLNPKNPKAKPWKPKHAFVSRRRATPSLPQSTAFCLTTPKP